MALSGLNTTHHCFRAVEACLAAAWPGWDLLGTMWHLTGRRSSSRTEL